MAMGSTQPMTEMITKNIPWEGKGHRCLGLKNLPPSYAEYCEIWEHQSSGNFRASSDP